MKIRAIRLADCGCFDTPVALEGLSGGLDLLVGANELGKSTIVKSLKLALTEKHTSRKAEIEALRPYRGGAPLIEIDFETGGESWRLRKRFLSDRLAELTIRSGTQLARGADVDSLLHSLLANGVGGAGAGLVWLEQGHSLEAVKVDAAGTELLKSVVAREITATAGGDKARRVRAAVRKRLGELVTEKRQQPTGDYLDAIRAAEQAATGLAQARAAHEAVEAALGRLGAIDSALKPLTDPAAAEARERVKRDAEMRLDKAQEAISAFEKSRLVVAERRAAQVAADVAMKRFSEARSELQRLQGLAAQDAAQREALGSELDEVAAVIEQRGAEIAELTARQQASEAAHRFAAVEARNRQLADRTARAKAAGDQAAALRRTLQDLPRDEGSLRSTRRLTARLGELRARLEAASSTVTVSYVPGGRQRLVVDGRELGDGERLLADRSLVIEVPGVGRLAIEPGASSDRAALLVEAEAMQADLATLFATAGVGDLASLEDAYANGRRVVSELAERDAELRALAPDGLEQLITEAAQLGCELEALAATMPGGTTAPPAAHLDEVRASLATAASARQQDESRRHALERQLAAIEGRGKERDRRCEELAGALPAATELEAHRSALEIAASESSRFLNEALRVQSVWSAEVPDDEAAAVMKHDVGAANAAIQQAAQERAALMAERSRIEGGLEAAQREDIATRVSVLEGDLERATQRRSDLEEEVGALQLLDRELGTEAERLSARYLAPVTERLVPYLEQVFPGASLELRDDYGVGSLKRGDREEALARLSDGTREQIAVLVRLAFARLLCDQGISVPLLLDDALVYSDDDRIRSMHRALEAAAAKHQVIVLSCREQAFAGLQGTRLALTPWRVG